MALIERTDREPEVYEAVVRCLVQREYYTHSELRAHVAAALGLEKGRGAGMLKKLIPKVLDQLQVTCSRPPGTRGTWGRVSGGNYREGSTEDRTVSMIYLRPTNDIPVNRLAASVIGPVWRCTEIL